MTARCQSCGKISAYELIPKQRKTCVQLICVLCDKAERDMEKGGTNWKKVRTYG